MGLRGSGAGSSPAPEGQRLVTASEFGKIYLAWSAEIRERLDPGEHWAVVGIKRRGAVLARRLRAALEEGRAELPYGEVDISLYRDDYHLRPNNPRVLGTEIAFPVDDTSILLVDDVLFSGRTVTAAMKLILDFGRPRRIWLAVFVDRGHRELPIAAHFVGREVDTQKEDHVLVLLPEMGDSEDAVELIAGGSV
jgi:pyrimidine operon attenuation protein/uracil phosphoribosyltransferase